MKQKQTHADTAAGVDQLLVVQLWAMLDAFEQRLSQEVAKMGLTVASFRLIGEVMQAPEGLRQSELAKRLRITAPSVSVAVHRLVEEGLLLKNKDPDDPRAVRIKLNPDASLLPGLEVLMVIEKEIAGGLGPQQKRQFQKRLSEVNEILRGSLVGES